MIVCVPDAHRHRSANSKDHNKAQAFRTHQVSPNFIMPYSLAGSLKIETKEAKACCGKKANEFLELVASTAPLNCPDTREGRKDFNVCHS
jgi:hypothetical protein